MNDWSISMTRFRALVSFALIAAAGCGGRPSDGGARINSSTVKVGQLFDQTLGSSCTAPDQCASGNCVSGVCCDTACTNQCDACNLTGLVGTCSPRPNGA